jgi:hypothetical protein
MLVSSKLNCVFFANIIGYGIINNKEYASMEKGDTVQFLFGLYFDERDTQYIVLDVNGEDVVIELICNLPECPVSVARKSELEVIRKSHFNGTKIR